MKLKLLTTFIIVFLATYLNAGQCPPLYVFDRSQDGDWLGESQVSGLDINNDGFNDFLIGAPLHNHGETAQGRVYAFSGKDGDTLFVFDGVKEQDFFGVAVALGDINNDGFADMIIGAAGLGGNDSGKVYVFSGKTGDTLFVFHGEEESDEFGMVLAGSGDVNGDGYDDVIIGANKNSEVEVAGGRVYIFSGKDADTLFILDGGSKGAHFGSDVSYAGDVNKDGFDDIIVSSCGSLAYPTNEIYVFSGHTGEILIELSGNQFLGCFDLIATSAGDVDNDGFDDIIIAQSWRPESDFKVLGHIYVISVRTGDTLFSLESSQEYNLIIYSVSTAGDVNNNGYDDIVVVYVKDYINETTYEYRTDVISVKGGELLYRYPISTLIAGYAGDINKDGFDDILMSAPGYFSFSYVYACCCFGSRGDFNSDGLNGTILDLTFLIDDIYRGGVESSCEFEADLNGDSSPSTVQDLTFLIDYIFRGGTAPPKCWE